MILTLRLRKVRNALFKKSYSCFLHALFHRHMDGQSFPDPSHTLVPYGCSISNMVISLDHPAHMLPVCTGNYLSLSRHLGAAIISKRVILSGKHGHNSTIEHIRMRPDGARCHCLMYINQRKTDKLLFAAASCKTLSLC